MREWAIQQRISHLALNDVLKIINTRFDNDSKMLPDDPRTLLKNLPALNVTANDDGEYCLENFLKILFPNLNESIEISLNINIDGVQVLKFNSGQFY